ncbi:hypothetical protein J4N46_05180 [Capnocytophaga sp. Marseille-Q4570]|jgi:hypothetical protein|uniref:Uncharacterized protein n=1 Tax=Capnocytophaga bilenii TaxID=2819369 RepID=A0ABS3PY42_9FLAO|nr:Imm9 family immunity protein [Capnocytophaga bilenii]MBO1883819.1 hypothetical protein [Capnocytophaga bilenii]
MNEKIRVSLQIEIPQLNEYVDINSIRQRLNDYVNFSASYVNVQVLIDWKLLIRVTFRYTNGIGVFKRAIRYPSDKEFEFSISVTIPNDTEALYGISKVNEAFYIPLNDKNFYVLEPNFKIYNNLYEYILENSKLAIDMAFTKGIVCNGKRLGYKNNG